MLYLHQIYWRQTLKSLVNEQSEARLMLRSF